MLIPGFKIGTKSPAVKWSTIQTFQLCKVGVLSIAEFDGKITLKKGLNKDKNRLRGENLHEGLS